MSAGTLQLHGYWRSTASYRVRIALNLKSLAYDQVTHDLRKAEHHHPDYLALAPLGLVPTLIAGETVLTQSQAILEWLEERHPSPALLPSHPDDRATVRAMASIIACDIHPLNNLRVLDTLKSSFLLEPPAIDAWITRWMNDGFQALEKMIARHGSDFAFGNQPGLADCYLIPQAYSARRFNVDLSPFPRIVSIVARAEAVPAFARAHPLAQPDADRDAT